MNQKELRNPIPFCRLATTRDGFDFRVAAMGSDHYAFFTVDQSEQAMRQHVAAISTQMCVLEAQLAHMKTSVNAAIDSIHAIEQGKFEGRISGEMLVTDPTVQVYLREKNEEIYREIRGRRRLEELSRQVETLDKDLTAAGAKNPFEARRVEAEDYEIVGKPAGSVIVPTDEAQPCGAAETPTNDEQS